MDAFLEQLQRTLASTVDGMSAEEFRWHPPDKWCAAEILEHLYLSYTGTTKGFERMLESGKLGATRSSIPQRIRGLVVFGFNYLPAGREAPSSTRPKGLPAEKIRTGFPEKIAAMDAAIAQAERRFGTGVPLFDHPFLGPLTGSRWRKFHLLHGLHHVKQIVRLREAMKKK
jgi:hypothetical protein